MAVAGEQRIGLGSLFNGSGFTPSGPLIYEVRGDGQEQALDVSNTQHCAAYKSVHKEERKILRAVP